MKKIYDFSKMMLVAMLAMVSLSSCEWWDDDDAFIANDLVGRWVGQFSEVYYDHLDWTASGTDYSTMFEFYSDRYDRYSGYGREVDYDRYNNVRELSFRWVVENGNIYLTYKDGMVIEIDGYSVRNDRLYGRGRVRSGTYDLDLEINLVRYEYADDPWDSGSYWWSRMKSSYDDAEE